VRTRQLLVTLTLALLSIALPRIACAGDGPAGDWNKSAAAEYLDARQKAWFAFERADRGEGANKTSCISCHTLLPYAIARPVLRKISGAVDPTAYETRLLEQINKRVAAWAELDTEEFALLYDFNEDKKKESLGTESVLNAVILAFDDRYRGRQTPSELTKKAFVHLWETQLTQGERKGSWEWLAFGTEPWESKNAPYFGAALAAIAVGTAPGYYTRGADAELDSRVDLLRGYLKSRLAEQGEHNRLWMLWASTVLDGLLDERGRSQIVDQLVSKRNTDGGWSLSSLGTFTRGDGTPQVTSSDGYATGLILHVFQSAGIGKDDPRVSSGLAWLRANQKLSGAWPGNSLNKERAPESSDPTKAFIGKFMWDAATAYSVLALSHAE
jgi:squalene-hopene/tetraprenyl-beta-curcumene cyclase